MKVCEGWREIEEREINWMKDCLVISEIFTEIKGVRLRWFEFLTKTFKLKSNESKIIFGKRE
jgi:hypothetical protein